MKPETIEAYIVINDARENSEPTLYHIRYAAEDHAKRHGGTVVRLTGEMPKVPIERKTTAWVEFREPSTNSPFTFDRLGIVNIAEGNVDRCKTKVEIIVRELSDE